MDSALPSTDTGSTLIKVLPVNHRLTELNTAATKLLTGANAPSGVSLHVIENWITSDAHGLEPLRASKHDGLNSLSNVRLSSDLVMLDHVYNNA